MRGELADRRQRDDDTHCGPVIAATLLDLCGFEYSEATERVARGLPVTQLDGLDPRTLEAFLRRNGLVCQSGEMGTADLAHHTKQGRPVAALIREYGGHWVAVIRVERAGVVFHDPLAGLRTKGRKAWEADWYDTDRFGHTYRKFGIATWREQ